MDVYMKMHNMHTLHQNRNHFGNVSALITVVNFKRIQLSHQMCCKLNKQGPGKATAENKLICVF